MDSRTVYVLSCICLGATALLVALAALSYPPPLRRNGFQWAAAAALLAAGMGFIGVRGFIPNAVSVLGGHLSPVAAFACFQHSLLRFQGRQPRLLWVYLPLPLALASASYFFFVAPNYGARVAAFSAITAAQTALCAWVLARGGGPAPRNARLTAFGFAACSALLVVRTVASLRMPAVAPPESILRPSALEQATIVVLFVAFFALSLSFVILGNESLSHELARQARTDALTGCLNRGTLEELAKREAARARRHDRLLSLALIDVDHLKAINDEHGHAAGDAALRHVGRVFAQAVRAQDLFGRYGGDEFLLVMPETGKADAVAACERVCRAVKSAIVDHGGVRLAITVSVGVATTRGNAADVAGLLSAADAALYAVKAGGRNSVRVAAAV